MCTKPKRQCERIRARFNTKECRVYKCEIFADLINIFQFFVILYREARSSHSRSPCRFSRIRARASGSFTNLTKIERKTNWTKWNYLECNIHHSAMARLRDVSTAYIRNEAKWRVWTKNPVLSFFICKTQFLFMLFLPPFLVVVMAQQRAHTHNNNEQNNT